jgi:hypothetical protein
VSSVPGTRDAGLQADGNPDFFKPWPRQPFVVVVHGITSQKSEETVSQETVKPFFTRKHGGNLQISFE